MTGRGRPTDDWDDARVDAAYRARFEVTPPTGLEDRIANDIRPTRSTPFLSFGWARTAAAGVVLVVILASTAALAGVGRQRGIAGTTPEPTSPSAPAPGSSDLATAPTTAMVWPFPDAVISRGAKYPVISVAEAVHTRANSDAPQTIGVGGWESVATDGRFCTFAPPGLLGQLQNQCVWNRWLGDELQPVSPSWYDPPLQPAIRFATDWRPSADDVHFRGGAFPRGSGTAVVFVGHFHDPLAAECQKDVATCSSVFVVGAVAWTLTLSTLRPAPADAPVTPMSLEEAIGIRDQRDATLEIAVGGWFARNVVPCPQRPDAQSPLEDCINDFTWLMANPEQLNTIASDGSGSIRAPSGPAISVVFGNREVPDWREPIYLVLIGHFRDPRAESCPAGDRRVACEKRFVMDTVLDVGGPSPEPTSTP